MSNTPGGRRASVELNGLDFAFTPSFTGTSDTYNYSSTSPSQHPTPHAGSPITHALVQPYAEPEGVFSGLALNHVESAPPEFEVMFDYTNYDGPQNHEGMLFKSNPDGMASTGDIQTLKSEQDLRRDSVVTLQDNPSTAPSFAAFNIYSFIEKPYFISAILHWRARQLFLRNDPKLTGMIDTQAVMVEIPRICHHLDPDDQQHVLNKLKELLQEGSTKITLNNLYSILATTLGVSSNNNNSSRDNQGFMALKPYQVPVEDDPIKASRRASLQPNPNKSQLDNELDRIKKERRRSHLAQSLVYDQDINTIAQYEDSRYRYAGKQSCGQCVSGYLICPIAVHRFPGMAQVSARFGSSHVKLFQYITSLIWLNILLGLFGLLLMVKGQKGFPWVDMTPYPITHWIDGSFRTFSFVPKRLGFFLGQGLEQSPFFYSDWYSDPSRKWLGKLTLPFLWTILPMILFIISLFFILAHLSKSAATTMDDTEKLILTVFSFDHRPKTRNSFQLQGLHFRSQLYSLTSILREKQFLQQHKQFFGNQLNLRIRRIFGILLNVIGLAGCCTGIVLLTVNEQAISRNIADQVNNSLIGQWAVPLFISLLKVVIPPFVKICVWIESRNVISTFQHTSSRIFVSKLFFIFVVLFQTLNSKIIVSDVDSTVSCRATITAVMLYRLLASDIVMDVGIELGMALIFFIWNLFWYSCLKRPRIPQLGSHPTYTELDEHLYKSTLCATGPDGQPSMEIFKTEFLPIGCIVDLLYQQTLVWVGLPFSPVMTYMGIVYFTTQYLARLVQLLFLSRMPKFSVPQNIQTNLINIFLSVSLACAILSYAVFFSTNVTCGPHYYHPGTTTGNSPSAGLIEQIYTLPSTVTVIINFLGSPILLLCVLGILGFIFVNYKTVLAQYTTDSKQLGAWLSAERTQLRALRKQFASRGTTLLESGSSMSAGTDGTAHFGGGDMTAEQLIKDKLHNAQLKTLSTTDFQREAQLLAQIRADEKDVEMLTRRAKSLFVDFCEDLPGSLSRSFQNYCVTILYFDDITPLLMMEREELLILLAQWNPALDENSAFTLFFLDLLTRYQSKMLL